LRGGAALWLGWALLWWRWRGGLWAVAMSAAMLGASVLMLYMVYARGYVFLLAALAGQLAAGLWWWRSVGLPSEALARRAWWLAAVVGLYAMPTYAYYYILLGATWLGAAAWGRCWRLMGADWWWTQVKVALVVGILYLPFAMAGGLGVLWRAAAEGDGAERWTWYDKWADWLLWGVDWRYTSLALAAMALAAMYSARRWGLKGGGAWLGLSLAGLLVMPLLIGAGQPLRVFVPSVLTWVAAMGVGLWWLRRWGVVAAVGLWVAAYAHYELRWSAPLDKAAVEVSALLCRENTQEIYCFSRYDKPLLEYYGLRRCAGRQWRLYLPFEDSRDYLPLDSRPHYEAVLLDIDDYAPTAADWAHVQQTGYRLVYADYRLRLYLWKGR